MNKILINKLTKMYLMSQVGTVCITNAKSTTSQYFLPILISKKCISKLFSYSPIIKFKESGSKYKNKYIFKNVFMVKTKSSKKTPVAVFSVANNFCWILYHILIDLNIPVPFEITRRGYKENCWDIEP